QLPQPGDGGDRVLALAEGVLQALEAPEQLARRAVAQAAQRLERVAQPLRPHAQAMELGRLRIRAEAAARAHHGAHVPAEQGASQARSRWAAVAKRAGRRGANRRSAARSRRVATRSWWTGSISPARAAGSALAKARR